METETEWQTICSDLKQRGGFLFKMGDWSDCTLLVGREKIPLRAHKLMLAMASPVFESLFYEGSEDKHTDTFYIPDAKPKSFSALLNYIYTDNINIHSFERARELYLAASKYMITQLACVCAEYLRWNLTMETACGTYEAALAVQDQMLMEESELIIKLHIEEILLHPSFEKLDLETVAMIFGFEELRVTEMDLINALQRCIKAQDGRKRSIGEADEPDLEATTRKQVRKALQQIRFLTIPADQFAQNVATSGLFSQADALAILMNLAGASAPMPAGFSSSRVVRGSPRVPPPPPPPPRGTLRLSVPAHTALRRSGMSVPTHVGDDSWVLRVLPVWDTSTASHTNSNSYFGIFLACMRRDKTSWSYRVQAEFVLVAHQPPAVNNTRSLDQVFTHPNVEWGYSKFVKTSEVLSPTDGYIRDGHLTFEVRIIVGATGQTSKS